MLDLSLLKAKRTLVAEANLAADAPRRERRCGDVGILLGDAADFEPPGRPLVLFFHHPFDATVFERVAGVERR